jgi:glutaredoxin
MKNIPTFNCILKPFRLLILILLLGFVANAGYTDKIPEIIVYGNEKCGYCSDTMKWLDEQKINFIYRDVELYGTFQEEMFNKLLRAGLTKTAYFPVLDIKGQILMRPKFDDIKKALAGEIIGSGSVKKNREALWRPEKKKSLTADFSSVKKNIRESDVIFYDDGSGSGKPLLRQIKKEGIPCTIRQLNKMSNAAYFEMSSRLAALGYGNITFFPVVEVRGEMIMKPSLDDVKILIIEMFTE